MLSAKQPYWRIRKWLTLILPLTLASAIASPVNPQTVPGPRSRVAPPGPGRTLTVRSDIQEADSKTGIVTARGNVQINYPARRIQATAAQAQYYSRERRIVLSGDVYVLQEGNSLRGETITYLMDEGRFIALPESQGQVESIYIVPADQDTAAESVVNPQAPKPPAKTPVTPPTFSTPTTPKR